MSRRMMIGKVRLDSQLVLAPMFGVTQLPFRLMCRRYGAGLVFSEMVNADAVIRNNKSTLRQATTCDEERPFSVQLFGAREDSFLGAAETLECDMVDLNFGCPDRKIVGRGFGAAMLKRPKKIGEIVKKLTSCLDKEITAKIRIGWDNEHINALEIAGILEEAGASAITVHGRTGSQGFRGRADWGIIKQVKESLSIPVIANGDIKDELSAEQCLKETGADFLMIGRAAIGEPYIFKRINHYLLTGKMLPRQDRKKKLEDFFEYLAIARQHNCLRYANMKAHAQWFTKGLKGGAIIRKELSKATSCEEVEEIMLAVR